MYYSLGVCYNACFLLKLANWKSFLFFYGKTVLFFEGMCGCFEKYKFVGISLLRSTHSLELWHVWYSCSMSLFVFKMQLYEK